MKYNRIMEVCRKLAPEDYACDQDSSDLLVGRNDKEIRKMYIVLDTTDKVMEVTMASGADMLLTHYPLIFKAIEKVNGQNFITRRPVKLIQADIFYYTMHTNFDAAPGCMTDLTIKRLGLSDYVPLEALGEVDGLEGVVSCGIDRSGVLKEEVTVRELAVHIKDVLDLPFALAYGDELMGQKASRVSVCPGAGGSEIEGTLARGAQALVTGGISHRQGIDVAARGTTIIDRDHYESERISILHMAEFLRKSLGSRVELKQAPPQRPVVIVRQENRILENGGGRWNGTG